MDYSQFHPYQVTEQGVNNLQLNISGIRKAVLIITWRLLPIFIIAMMVILAVETNNGQGLPLKIKLGLAFIALVACAMFLVKIIFQININSTFIEIVSYRFFFNSTKKYFLSEVTHIQALFSDHVRGGAIFYTLQLKNQKQVEFMRQPTISSTREDMMIVCSKLQEVTKMEVKIKERPQ